MLCEFFGGPLDGRVMELGDNVSNEFYVPVADPPYVLGVDTIAPTLARVVLYVRSTVFPSVFVHGDFNPIGRIVTQAERFRSLGLEPVLIECSKRILMLASIQDGLGGGTAIYGLPVKVVPVGRLRVLAALPIEKLSQV